jgi:hypothetical protein
LEKETSRHDRAVIAMLIPGGHNGAKVFQTKYLNAAEMFEDMKNEYDS